MLEGLHFGTNVVNGFFVLFWRQKSRLASNLVATNDLELLGFLPSPKRAGIAARTTRPGAGSAGTKPRAASYSGIVRTYHSRPQQLGTGQHRAPLQVGTGGRRLCRSRVSPSSFQDEG